MEQGGWLGESDRLSDDLMKLTVELMWTGGVIADKSGRVPGMACGVELRCQIELFINDLKDRCFCPEGHVEQSFIYIS